MDIRILAAIAAGVAFVIAAVLYKIFIPVLRKVKLGQKILEIGPSWHKCKEGTPTLGGLFFTLAALAAIAAAYAFGKDGGLGITPLMLVFGFALLNGLIGFVDDYVKLFKKRNKGLSAGQKLVLQFLAGALYLWFAVTYGNCDTDITLPWGGVLRCGVFYYVIMLLAMTYITNCANLTDGIDGLAGSIAFIIGVTFFIFGINGGGAEMAILSAAVCGALAAFLIFNFHPAKIFMGDTGSLFLGGYAVGLAMLTGSEFILLPISALWIMEGLSVVIQVISFKLTGKRVFKMSPIHHHFEKCGWSEVKIVAVFSLVTALFCALAYWLMSMNAANTILQ